MRFSYTAEKAGGDTYQGVAEAKDRFELYQVVRREGGRLVNVREEGRNKYLTLNYWNTKFATISEQEKILFTRNLGSMLTAGLPLSRALAIIERQSKNARLRETVTEVGTAIRHGDPFHAALAKYPHVFSKLMIAMVKAGEEGGDLPAALLVVSEQMERASDLKKKVRGALIYPTIILFAIVVIGYLMMTKVVPTLASTFKEMNASLPPTTQAIITISDILVNYTALVAVVAAALVAGFAALLRTKQGKWASEIAIVYMPIIGELVKEVNAARTARTMASLLSAGVDVVTTIDIASEVVQNSLFQDVLREAHRSVVAGEAISQTFARHENLYPAFVGEMMAVGEETGQTADMLKRLAIYYEDEVDRKTKDMSTIIEPFLMLFIGAGVGFFAVAMITPIYSLSQNM